MVTSYRRNYQRILSARKIVRIHYSIICQKTFQLDSAMALQGSMVPLLSQALYEAPTPTMCHEIAVSISGSPAQSLPKKKGYC